MSHQDFKFSLHLKTDHDNNGATIDVECGGYINDGYLDQLSFAVLGALKAIYKGSHLTELGFALMLAQYINDERTSAEYNLQKSLSQIMQADSADESSKQ